MRLLTCLEILQSLQLDQRWLIRNQDKAHSNRLLRYFRFLGTCTVVESNHRAENE